MFNLIVKDLKRVLRDKKALAIILLMPMVLMTILGFTIGKFMGNDTPWLGADTRIGIVILDNREDVPSRIIETFNRIGISNDLLSEENISKTIKDINFKNTLLEVFELEEIKSFISYEILDKKEAMEMLSKGEISSLIIVPEDFTYNTFMSLGTPFVQRQEIEVIVNKNRQFTGRIIKQIVESYTNVISAAIIGKDALLEIGVELGVGSEMAGEIEKITRGLFENNRNIGITIENANTMRTVNGMQYYAVAQGMMFVLYVVGFFAKFALDEREYHTHDRLLLSNLNPSKVLLSIGISSGIIVLLQILIFSVFSTIIFNISWGNSLNVAILSLFVALAIMGMTSLVSAINIRTSNAKIANIFDGLVVSIFALLGGSFVPLTGAPTLERVGRLTPNGAAINGFIKNMQGYELKEVMPSIVILTIIFAVSLISSKFVLKGKGA